MSSDITWPTSHRVSHRYCITSISSSYGLLKTHFDFAWFVSSDSGDDSLPSKSFQDGDLLGSVTQGELETIEEGGRCWSMVGRPALSSEAILGLSLFVLYSPGTGLPPHSHPHLALVIFSELPKDRPTFSGAD